MGIKAYFTLKSFVDNNTGRDYVKEAQEKILELFNPEEHNVTVNYWNVEDGVLKLDMGLFPSNLPGLIRLGGYIPVKIILETGEISIAPEVVDAVTKARMKTSQKLNIGIGDVHVNSIESQISVLRIYPPDVSYVLSVSTPKFNLTYNYHGGYYSGADNQLQLVSLVNRD